ncbi:hypothetical protein H0H87_001966 [Tephrocybe sp. NHM501043]|nr:hypothetical protein H0H87_001966 [Tephrocybe sp. NHM501043]
MAYRDPYEQQPGRSQHQTRYSEPTPDFDPYTSSPPHQTYDQGGIGASYDSYGAGYSDEPHHNVQYPPNRSNSQHRPHEDFGQEAKDRHLETGGFGEKTPRALRNYRYENQGALWTRIQLVDNGISINLGVNISVNNPNYFAVNFKEIKVDIIYPINDTQIGAGDSKDVVFNAHQLTNWTFPFTITYKTSNDPQGLIIQDLSSKCGVTGTKSNLNVHYKLTLALRILFITVSPVISNSFDFPCPMDASQLEVRSFIL